MSLLLGSVPAAAAQSPHGGTFVVGLREGAVATIESGSFLGERVAFSDAVLGFVVVEARDAAAFKARALRDADVRYVDSVQFAEPFYAPSDPKLASQYQWTRVNAGAAWDVTKGSKDVVVAIIDSGVDLTHPDLVDNLVAGYDHYNKDSTPEDSCGHGTPAAGLIAAVMDNGVGVTGGAQISLMPLKVMEKPSTGGCLGPYPAIAKAVRDAADKGARVISMSLGCSTCYDQATSDALEYAWAKGALIVAGAGNKGGCTDCVAWPAKHPRVIGVGCSNELDLPCPDDPSGTGMDIVAPGVNVYTTKKGGGYGLSSGTSFSTPQVAAAAALIFSVNPALTNTQAEKILLSTAKDIGLPGVDAFSGHGLLDMGAAVALAQATPALTPPTPSYAHTVISTQVDFDASASTSTNGAITSYVWDWGHGTLPLVSSKPTATHSFPGAGTYQVNLTVRDEEGAAATTKGAVVKIGATNKAPVASFTLAKSGASITVNAAASYDPDGSIASYSWTFGDGSTGSGVTATHTYKTTGTFTVKLTVKDNDGKATSTTKSVGFSSLNKPPSPSFTATTSGLSVSLDGSASNDADGSIASYSWALGDGKTATGATPTHTYAAPGSYVVKLTVKDNVGASASMSKIVTVAKPNEAPVVDISATMEHLVAQLDASASKDPDGSIAKYAWSFGDGATATGAKATHSYATSGTYVVTLIVTDDKGASSTGTSVVVATKPNAPPVAVVGGSMAKAVLSATAAGSYDPDGSIASYAWDFGDGAKGWGSSATHAYESAGTFVVTLTVTDDKGAKASESLTVVAAPNLAPIAAVAATAVHLSASFSAAGSLDPDGSLASYSWNFGDGSTGAGFAPKHSYAMPGTFVVTLTVTDDDGAKSSATTQLTVSAPPPVARVASVDGSLQAAGRSTSASWTVAVFDTTGAPVQGATVTTRVTLPNGASSLIEATPAGNGLYTVSQSVALAAGQSVTLVVESVSAPGYDRDSSADASTTSTLTR